MNRTAEHLNNVPEEYRIPVDVIPSNEEFIPEDDNLKPKSGSLLAKGFFGGGLASVASASAIGIASTISGGSTAEAGAPDCVEPAGEVAGAVVQSISPEEAEEIRIINEALSVDLGIENSGPKIRDDGALDYGNGVIGPNEEDQERAEQTFRESLDNSLQSQTNSEPIEPANVQSEITNNEPTVDDAKKWLDGSDGNYDNRFTLTIPEGSNVDREVQKATGLSPDKSWAVTVGAGLGDRHLVGVGEVVHGEVNDAAAKAVISGGANIPVSQVTEGAGSAPSNNGEGEPEAVSESVEDNENTDASATSEIEEETKEASPFRVSSFVLNTGGEASAVSLDAIEAMQDAIDAQNEDGETAGLPPLPTIANPTDEAPEFPTATNTPIPNATATPTPQPIVVIPSPTGTLPPDFDPEPTHPVEPTGTVEVPSPTATSTPDAPTATPTPRGITPIPSPTGTLPPPFPTEPTHEVPTVTPSATPTETPEFCPTPTPTPRGITPIPSPTGTLPPEFPTEPPHATATPTVTPTATETPTNTPTETPTNTPTETPSPTNTPSPTATETVELPSPTATATNTEVPPTATGTSEMPKFLPDTGDGVENEQSNIGGWIAGLALAAAAAGLSAGAWKLRISESEEDKKRKKRFQ